MLHCLMAIAFAQTGVAKALAQGAGGVHDKVAQQAELLLLPPLVGVLILGGSICLLYAVFFKSEVSILKQINWEKYIVVILSAFLFILVTTVYLATINSSNSTSSSTLLDLMKMLAGAIVGAAGVVTMPGGTGRTAQAGGAQQAVGAPQPSGTPQAGSTPPPDGANKDGQENDKPAGP